MTLINSINSRFATEGVMTSFKITMFLFLVTYASSAAQAQTFNSGSTGALGAYNPTSDSVIDLPPDGKLNFTTINISANVDITIRRNAANTPAFILASGNCTINGSIRLVGEAGQNTLGFGLKNRGGRGGAGGFDGGGGGLPFDPHRNGVSGDGPGGGGGSKTNGAAAGGAGGAGFLSAGVAGRSIDPALAGSGGNRYGSKMLLPMIGGSGGGGGSAPGTVEAPGGGGGGGAILIACSGTMTIGNEIIAVNGGAGTCNGDNGCSGGGSGGAIRLMATTIVGGSPDLDVRGGAGGGSSSNTRGGGDGSAGFISIEAYNSTNFTPRVFPNVSAARYDIPGKVFLDNAPTLRITTVAGINAPAEPKGTLGNGPDIVFTTPPTNPVTVGLQATNIPVNTIITVILTPESGAYSTVQSTPLAGTSASSTATASVNLPQGRSLLNAIVTIDVNAGTAYLAPGLIEGERVKQIKIAAVWGGDSELIYITESGKEIRKRAE